MKIGFVSLGCPKNLVDSEVMLGLAQEAGHTITPDASDADVIVVNTCAFIDSAKQESIDAILEMAQEKTQRGARLIVAGCLAERYREELQREIPEIDAVLGTNEVPEIVRAIQAATDRRDAGPTESMGSPRESLGSPTESMGSPRESLGGPTESMGWPTGSTSMARPTGLPTAGAPRTPAPGAMPVTLFRRGEDLRPTYLYDEKTPRVLATPRHYAYVKVAEGCDYKCAFCIIPTLRGAYRSRPAASIVDEATRLAGQGVRELLLISQDTTFYGVDRGERGALGRLLRQLNHVDGLEWIRLLYLYPTTIDDGVLSAMAECDKVCKYVDLPLQHASAAVLKRMKRPGNSATYARLIRRIRARVPDVTLRTTFIVGYPGETEAEFGELLRFVEDVRFDHVGVFTYSHEEGTSAYALKDDVPARTKQARRDAVMRLQKRLVKDRHRGWLGRRVRLVVDGPAPDHELVLKGRLEGQAPDIDPVVYLSDCDPSALEPGTFVEAELVASRGYDLVARFLDGAGEM
jgi:ribosomal protein S12 methylthiotransferase